MTPSDDQTVVQAVLAVMQNQLTELRAIKTAERGWLERYTVLILVAVSFLLLSERSLSRSFLVIVACAYFALAAWIADVLRKERKSYYRILRSVVRAQNFLGLFRIRFLAESHADPYPIGMGPNPSRDGTQPYSSFFHRQIFVGLMFALVVTAIVYRDLSLWWLGVLLGADLWWVIRIFQKDREELQKESAGDRGLAGAPDVWFPAK